MPLVHAIEDSRTVEYLTELKDRRIFVIDTHVFWTYIPYIQPIRRPLTMRPEILNSFLQCIDVYGIGIPTNIYQNEIASEVVKSCSNIIGWYYHFNPNKDYAKEVGYIPPKELGKIVKSSKFGVGFKTIPSLTHTPVDDAKNAPFYEIAIKHDLPVLIHCARQGIDYTHIEHFKKLSEMYPELKIIMARFGGLKIESMKAAVSFAERKPNVFLNTTALNPFMLGNSVSNKDYKTFNVGPLVPGFCQKALEIFLDATNKFPDRIVYGSDVGEFNTDTYSLWPIYELKKPKLEKKILSENPRKIFRGLKLSRKK